MTIHTLRDIDSSMVSGCTTKTNRIRARGQAKNPFIFLPLRRGDIRPKVRENRIFFSAVGVIDAPWFEERRLLDRNGFRGSIFDPAEFCTGLGEDISRAFNFAENIVISLDHP